MGIFFAERVEVTQITQWGYFLSERVELLRLLNEGIFFRSGLSYSDHSMRVFFFGAGWVTQTTQWGYFFRSGLSYSDHSVRVFFRSRLSYSMRVFFRSGLRYWDHSMRVFFSERVELLRSLNEAIFSERVELLRSLNEGIFFRSGLRYSDYSMRVFFRSGLSYSDHSTRVFFRSELSYSDHSMRVSNLQHVKWYSLHKSEIKWCQIGDFQSCTCSVSEMFPRLPQGSNPGPLVPEASALTTRLLLLTQDRSECTPQEFQLLLQK